MAERLTGEGGDIVVVIWYCRVSLGISMDVVTRSTVQRVNTTPVMQSPINDTGEGSGNGAISPTFAALCSWMRCRLRTAVFE